MKKTFIYIAFAMVLSILFTGCSKDGGPYPNDDNPMIDPPVNEIAKKNMFDNIKHTKLEVYEYEVKHIRKAQEQIEFDTVQ